MDLSTTYLGFDLPHPFMPGASPLVDSLDMVKRLEDAGASAIVMHSLFEEQIVREQLATMEAMESSKYHYAEMITVMPEPEDFSVGPDDYLGKLQRIKEAVGVPVIASLNGTTLGGWVDYARLMQQAGADALELNVYELAADPDEDAEAVERRLLHLVRAVRENVRIPVAVKLSPFYTSMANVAKRLDELVEGLVVFNRFYQPDIDIEELEVARVLTPSDSSELLLRLRWLAMLAGRVNASLACTGGVHTPVDAIKAVMCGADAVQMVSALLRHGPQHLTRIRDSVEAWMEEHEYESLRQMKGSMSLQRTPDPGAYERANYMHILQSWKMT